MDTVGTVGILAVVSGTITFLVETIKAWVPAKHKDAAGLVFERKGKPTIHLPSQAVWPAVSMVLGVVIFIGFYLISQYNPLGVGSYLGSALTGVGVGTGGGAAGFRLKNVLGSAAGGNDATSAQATGPTTDVGGAM